VAGQHERGDLGTDLTFSTAPEGSSSHPLSTRCVASHMAGPNRITSRRENTGWISRRWRRQSSPSLVSRPLPISARNGR